MNRTEKQSMIDSLHEEFGRSPHAVLVDIALNGAAERGGEPAIDLRRSRTAVAQLDDAAEIRDRFLGRAAHVRQIVAVAD